MGRWCVGMREVCGVVVRRGEWGFLGCMGHSCIGVREVRGMCGTLRCVGVHGGCMGCLCLGCMRHCIRVHGGCTGGVWDARVWGCMRAQGCEWDTA